MNTYETQTNDNVLAVGGTGSGKTVGVGNPMLYQLKYGNAVGVFTKRGATSDIRKYLESMGYRVLEIDLTHPERSDYGYDPLHYCKTDGDIIALSNVIIHSSQQNRKPSSSDPYWEDSAESALTPILRYVRNGHYAKGRSLVDALGIVEMLPGIQYEYEWKEGGEALEPDDDDSEQEKRQKAAMRILKDIIKNDPKSGMNIEAFAALPEQTRNCVIGSLTTPLTKLFTDGIRQFMSNPKMFDFEELLQPRTVLFVFTSPVNSAYNRFMGIFYEQLFKNLFELAEAREDHKLPYPVYVLCDDFATGCHVPDFPEMISIFREKQISTVLLIQSESQLEDIYGFSGAQTIINNCDTYIYLGGMDIKTSKSIADRLNKPYTDVLNMPIGAEYFFHRGQRPVATQRLCAYAGTRMRLAEPEK